MAREIPKQANVSYQFQRRKCGRSTCKSCKQGIGHGPYWYAYWRDGKRVVSAYTSGSAIRKECIVAVNVSAALVADSACILHTAVE